MIITVKPVKTTPKERQPCRKGHTLLDLIKQSNLQTKTTDSTLGGLCSQI